MIKLTDILKEELDKRKFMKAALEIANSYARRGYDPKEAISNAAVSVKHTEGYELTDEDKKNLEKLVFVHPNFR